MSARPGRVFYGWWIVLAGTIGTTLHAGLFQFAAGVFFLPLLSEFGTSRAVLSGVVSLSSVESGLSGPIAGFLTDRLGPRKVMLVGAVLASLGYLVVSRVTTLLSFYLVYVLLMAVGISFFGGPITTSVANWFRRRRSLALSITNTGFGLGAFISPAVAFLVFSMGWRGATAVTGLLFLLVGIPVALVMRHRPEQYGTTPDGVDTASEAEVASNREPEPDFGPMEALRTPSFWFLSLAFAIRVFSQQGLFLHLIPALKDIGFSERFGATMLGAFGFIGIGGRLGFGFLADYVSKRLVMALNIAMMGAGVLVLAFAHELWQVVLSVVIFGLGQGGASTVTFAIRADYFGRRSYATIQGFMSSVGLLGTVSGPIFTGFLYDALGSYTLAFLIQAGAGFFAAFLMLFARKPQFRRKAS